MRGLRVEAASAAHHTTRCAQQAVPPAMATHTSPQQDQTRTRAVRLQSGHKRCPPRCILIFIPVLVLQLLLQGRVRLLPQERLHLHRSATATAGMRYTSCQVHPRQHHAGEPAEERANAHTRPASSKQSLPACCVRRAGTHTHTYTLTDSPGCPATKLTSTSLSRSSCHHPAPPRCPNWAARLRISGTSACSTMGARSLQNLVVHAVAACSHRLDTARHPTALAAARTPAYHWPPALPPVGAAAVAAA